MDARSAKSFVWAAATAGAMACLATTPTHAEPQAGDPVRGRALFLQCRACHAVTADAPAGAGPTLWGVVGSKAGARPGFTYSASLKETGIVWGPETLDRWLTQPTAVAPGTMMAFQGVPTPKARADIIAYLSTLGPTVAVKAGGR